MMRCVRLSLKVLSLSMLGLAPMAQGAEIKEVIKNLAGCFEVTYRFVEDGTERDLEIRGALESITLEERGETLVFQHYGIMEGQTFKHLSEEWTPQGDGRWTQKVYGPSGAFRYECTAPFEFNQWKCAASRAPKPQRDKNRNRIDYATLDRSNTVQITPAVWVQSEVNIKRDANKVAIANEVGWVEYKKVDAARCKTNP